MCIDADAIAIDSSNIIATAANLINILYLHSFAKHTHARTHASSVVAVMVFMHNKKNRILPIAPAIDRSMKCYTHSIKYH